MAKSLECSNQRVSHFWQQMSSPAAMAWLLFLMVLLGTGPQSHAATYAAASVNQSDVAAAVALCNHGDTVTIPAGTASWASPVTTSKAINLIGVPGQTTIYSPPNPSGYALYFSAANVTNILHISGLNINGRGNGGGIYLQGHSINFRIDHCGFSECGFTGTQPTGYSRGIYVDNPQLAGSIDQYGVIDHSGFTNCTVCFEVKGGDCYSLHYNTNPFGIGTTNCIVLEDDFFYRDATSTTVSYMFFDSTQGARIHHRHNTYQVNGHVDSFWVIHGNNNLASQLGDCLSDHGTVFVIVEQCQFNMLGNADPRMFYVRGGCFIAVSNTISDPNNIWRQPFSLTDEECWYASAGNGNFGGVDWSTWPRQDQITNSWFCANTKNGVLLDASAVSIYDSFNNNAANCIQNGRDYFVTNKIPPMGYNNPGIPGGMWGYTPLVYPHPLVAPPAPPTHAVTQVSPTSLAWEMQPGTGSSNQVLTVRNVGIGTLTGSVSISTASSPSPWSIVGPTTYSVTTNTSATITVQYTPTSPNDSQATLTFADNGGGQTVALSGGRPKTYFWPLGDSITQGNDVPGGYRLPLYQMLTNAGINAAFVGNASDNPAPGLPYPNHDGYGGYEIGDIAAGVPNWLSGIRRPDYVMLLIGLNDFRHNDDVQHATNRLENLIVEIATNVPAAKIIVADLNPWTNLQPTNAVMDLYYNPFIPGVVARQAGLGRKVYLCDMRGKLSATDLEADNTHPTQSGYNKIATNWMSIISPSSGGTKPTPPTNLHIVSASP